MTLDDARALGVRAVAERLGLSIGRRQVSPCPACGSSGRGSVRVFARLGGPERWHCHRCDVGGDGPDLVAWRVLGARCDRENTIAVLAWYDGGAAIAPVAPLPTRDEYPPRAEVAALLRSCSPAAADPEVSAWLVRRLGYDVASVLPPGLVGALSLSRPLPGWAGFGPRSWAGTGHRAIFPAYSALGLAIGVRARYVWEAPVREKALPPRGFSCRGLTLGNSPARSMLRGELSGTPRRIVIAEGEPAFLTWATRCPEDPVLGLFSGSWSEDFTTRIPLDVPVVIATDHDPAGHRYARAVEASLRGRNPIARK